jgi:hypothetical protein
VAWDFGKHYWCTGPWKPGLGNLTTLSTVGHYWSYIFCAREAMTISHVGFRVATAAGSPTAEVRIETVDGSTGLPSGTLWATNTNGTTGTISSSSNVLQALTASASISAGQVFCVKVALASGTSIQIQLVGSTVSPSDSVFPYTVVNTGAASKATLSGFGTIALGSSSTTFYQVPGLLPASAVTASTFNNTSSARRGMRFTPPMNCRAVGVRWYNANTVGDFNAAIFDDAGTELSSSSTAFDGDNSAASTSPNRPFTVYFDNAVTLSAGTTYRVAIEPTTTTNVSLTTVTLPSTNYRGATPAGTTAHYTTYVASSWTDTATDQLPFMDILIDQVDDGTGSGGGGGGGQRVFGG